VKVYRSAIVFGACNLVAIGIQFFSTAAVSEVSSLLASLLSGSRRFQCENSGAQIHAGKTKQQSPSRIIFL